MKDFLVCLLAFVCYDGTTIWDINLWVLPSDISSIQSGQSWLKSLRGFCCSPKLFKHLGKISQFVAKEPVLEGKWRETLFPLDLGFPLPGWEDGGPASQQPKRQDLRDKMLGDLSRDSRPGQTQQRCPHTKECGNRPSIMTQWAKEQETHHPPSSSPPPPLTSLPTAEVPWGVGVNPKNERCWYFLYPHP